MIATHIFKKTQIDNGDDKKNDYNYGTLIKTETHYISKKVRNNGFEKENLEAIYTLTFLDKKTNIIESFQYNLLPDNIGKNYFYSFSEGVIDILSENKNDYIKLLNDKKINSESQHHLFLSFLCIFMLVFYLLIPILAPSIKNDPDPFFVFFNFIRMPVAIFLAIISSYLIYDYVKIKKNKKNSIDKIQKNLEKVTTDEIDVASNCYENYRYGELVKTVRN